MIQSQKLPEYGHKTADPRLSLECSTKPETLSRDRANWPL